jgi:hypothetical protein
VRLSTVIIYTWNACKQYCIRIGNQLQINLVKKIHIFGCESNETYLNTTLPSVVKVVNVLNSSESLG